MSFYLKLGLAVNDQPDGPGGPAIKRGDITHIHPFDVWEERSKGGKATRKHDLIIFLQLPDGARGKVGRLISKYREFGQWDDQAESLDTVVGNDITKRRISIPFQMIQDRFPTLWASVSWQRVIDQEDDYQPWEDRIFILTADMKDFLWDKLRNAYLTHQQALDNLGGGM